MSQENVEIVRQFIEPARSGDVDAIEAFVVSDPSMEHTRLPAASLSAIMAAAVVGCGAIIAVDVKAPRLELARELGATHLVNAADSDPVEAIRELTGGGADYSLEMSGVPAVLRQAVECLAPDSTCGVIGAPPFGVAAELDVNDIIAMGRTVRGIVEGHSVPDLFIPQLIDLWRAGKLPVDRLIKTYDFDAINEAAEAAGSGAVVKSVLRVG